MRSVLSLAFGLAAVLALPATSAMAQDTCGRVTLAPPAGLCDGVTLDSRMPPDVAKSPDSVSQAEAQRMFDCLSWKTFVALSWPADDTCRGLPDTTRGIADDGRRVWETYKTVYEVFRNDDAGWDPSDQPWNGEEPAIACDLKAAATGRKVVHMTTKGAFEPHAVTEHEQAFATSFGQLTDQSGNLVRYEIRFNRDEFEHIRETGAAKTGAYGYGGPGDAYAGANGAKFLLPDNTNGFEGVGTLEVKASWKEITATDDASRYFTQEALIYDADAAETCREATMGLIGLHLARKTWNAPQMTWATFEHDDNTPPAGSNGDGRDYTLFSAQCAANPPPACWSVQPPITDRDLACCPNLELNTAVLKGIPTQATRLVPVGPTALNTTFRKLLADAGSPFQHYHLVNTQFTLGGRDPDNPDVVRTRFCNPNGPWAIPASDEDCFTQVPDSLRNTSMETFMASFGAGTTMKAADSCLNCHVAGGVDGSYLWLDAKLVPVPTD